jgi:hypothetical protein
MRGRVPIAVSCAVALAGCSGSSHRTPPVQARTGAASRASPKPRTVTITVEASGDLLIHAPIWQRALKLGGGRHYDFAPMLAQARPYIARASLALCHVETPMTPAPPTGYPIFNTPPALARAIRQTGFDACSTAGTHTLDEGQTGVDDTIKRLDEAGVKHTGSFASAGAQKRTLIVTIKGVKVAFLAYTELTNGIPSPHAWSVNRASASRILADARRARRDGARVVIVNVHWGDENVSTPSAFQLRLADELTRSSAITALVGQHVHVVQPIRRINGKPVVFGEGNLISNQTVACCPAASQDGLIAILTIRVTGTRAHVTFIHYVPVWVRHPDFVVLPVGRALRNDRGDEAALRASYARTVAAAGRSRDVQPIPARLP